MSDLPSIRVVSAEIRDGGRWLIVQRPASAVLPLLWEFPGGKVGEGETDEEALIRGVLLRLGVAPEVGEQLMGVTHSCDRYQVTLAVYRCSLGGSEPALAKLAAMAWVTPEQMGDYPFPGADQQTVDALLSDLE